MVLKEAAVSHQEQSTNLHAIIAIEPRCASDRFSDVTHTKPLS